MLGCEAILIQYCKGLQKGEDVTLYEDAISDLLFNYLEMEGFYEIPTEFISKIVGKTYDLIPDNVAEYVLLNIQRIQKKNVSSILSQIERVLTPAHFAELLLKVDSCPDINESDAKSRPVPKPSSFPVTSSPTYMELLERMNDSKMKPIVDAYEKQFADIRAEIRDMKSDANDDGLRLKAAKESAEKAIVEANENGEKREKELSKQIEELTKQYEDVKAQIGRNPEQKELYEKWMKQEDAHEESMNMIEDKITHEVADARKTIDTYIKQNNGKKIIKREEGKVEEEEDFEYVKISYEEEEDGDFNFGNGDEEEDTIEELVIPAEVKPIKIISKVKVPQKPTKIRTLFDAIALENIEEINNFIEKKPKIVFEKGYNRTTPVIEAVRTGNVEIVKLLVENGADPEVKDGFGNNAFHIAAAIQSIPIVKYLAEIGVKKNVKDKEGRTPLDILTQRESASINLYEACKTDNAREMGDSLRAWPDMVNIRYEGLASPLHIAAGHNFTTFCEKLLAWGANINSQDSQGNTPLHYAVIFGSLRTAQFLLDHGANPEIKNKAGKTALELQK